LQQELTTEKTGFDILIETKDANLKAIMDMLKKNPNLTRREVMDKLGVSDRTATRYFGIIRKLKPKLLRTSVDEEVEAKAKRIEKMKKIMTEHPEKTREQVRKEIGVSRRTLYQYLASLEMVE
jgi:predicted DNA-binding transcriptional regulator YafY